MGKPYKLKKINGREHKHCNGPTHPEGGKWLPISMFTTRRVRTGTVRLRGNCRRCEHFFRYRKVSTHVGYVPLNKYRFAIFELERRLGKMEAARRVGVGKTTWYRWGKDAQVIQAAKAALLIQTLHEVRNSQEVRHRLSISRGTTVRKETERIPTAKKHFYKQHGDSDNAYKKVSRARVG